MDEKWVIEKDNEREKNFISAKKYLISVMDKYLNLANTDVNKDDYVKHVIDSLNKSKETLLSITRKSKKHYDFLMDYKMMLMPLYKNVTSKEERIKVSENVDCINSAMSIDKNWLKYMYLDSDVLRFDGDIVITDPCYAFDDIDFRTSNPYIERSTIYGDWECGTFDADTNKLIGKFCADSGSVCVVYLSDILKYKPDFVERCPSHCYTIIKNFHGTVQLVVTEDKGSYTDDGTEKKYEDYSVSIKGNGNINFYTKQTGL